MRPSLHSTAPGGLPQLTPMTTFWGRVVPPTRGRILGSERVTCWDLQSQQAWEPAMHPLAHLCLAPRSVLLALSHYAATERPLSSLPGTQTAFFTLPQSCVGVCGKLDGFLALWHFQDRVKAELVPMPRLGVGSCDGQWGDNTRVGRPTRAVHGHQGCHQVLRRPVPEPASGAACGRWFHLLLEPA